VLFIVAAQLIISSFCHKIHKWDTYLYILCTDNFV